MSRLGEVFRSLLFYAIFYTGTAGFVLVCALTLPLRRTALQRVVTNWSRFHRRCVTGLLGIRVLTTGSLPGGEFLVAMKHESFFEAIDLPAWLNVPAIFAKAELLRIPFWGPLAATYGLIAVERDQGARALRSMMRAGTARQREGRSLVIFPEGTRVEHGVRAPLQSGFAGLYKLLGMPVVPVAVDSAPLYHRWWKRRGTITIAVGEPIPPGLSRAEIEARVVEAINVLNPPPRA